MAESYPPESNSKLPCFFLTSLSATVVFLHHVDPARRVTDCGDGRSSVMCGAQLRGGRGQARQRAQEVESLE